MDESLKKEIFWYLKLLGFVLAVVLVGLFCFMIAFAYTISKPTIHRFYSSDHKFDIKTETGGDLCTSRNTLPTLMFLEAHSGREQRITEVESENFEILWHSNRCVSINFSSDLDFSHNQQCIELDGETVNVFKNSPAQVSDDHFYLAKMQRDAAKPSEGNVFVERADLQQRWLIGKQNLSTKKYNLCFIWRPKNHLFIRGGYSTTLTTTEIEDGSSKIHITLLPEGANNPD